MNRAVETYTEVIGYHRWKAAPEQVCFLRSLHRHRFEIRCRYAVEHNDRQIEIFMQERAIFKALSCGFPHSVEGEFDFGSSSCEDIAQFLIESTGCYWCQVLEDGKGGALVWK